MHVGTGGRNCSTRRKPLKHSENMQAPRTQSVESKPQHRSCKANVLTTKLRCLPDLYSRHEMKCLLYKNVSAAFSWLFAVQCLSHVLLSEQNKWQKCISLYKCKQFFFVVSFLGSFLIILPHWPFSQVKKTNYHIGHFMYNLSAIHKNTSDQILIAYSLSISFLVVLLEQQ